MVANAQEQVQLLTIPFDWHLSVTTQNELALLAVPHGKNVQLEVLSVGYTNRILVDSGTHTVDLEWRDALRDAQNGLATTMAAYTFTNVTPDRVLDCDSTSTAEVADVLGTLVADLKLGLPLPAYTITNLTRALLYNEGDASLATLADQVGQIINDIVDGRIVNVVQTESSTDRVIDADSTTDAELADCISVLHRDLTPTADLADTVNLVNAGIEGYVSIWEGSQILNQGDTLNLEIANSDSSTDGEGYAAIVEFKVLRHSGG
jgi:hypothetical protein